MTHSFESKINLCKAAGLMGLGLGAAGLGAAGIGGAMYLANKGFNDGHGDPGVGGSSFEQQGLDRVTSGIRDLYNSKNTEMTNNLHNWQANPNLESLAGGHASPGSSFNLTDSQKNLAMYGGLGVLGYSMLRGGPSGKSIDELTALVNSRMGK